MYEVIIPSSVVKSIRKMDKSIAQHVKRMIGEIAETPYSGTPLTGDLSSIRKWTIQVQGIQYRIAYEINEEIVQVKIIRIGTRENFYNELKRRM